MASPILPAGSITDELMLLDNVAFDLNVLKVCRLFETSRRGLIIIESTQIVSYM